MRIPRARIVALAVGVGALGSLAAAPAALAAGASPKPPAVGVNCQPDGKINGGGSTFQTNGINDALTYGFQQDVCGPQPSVSNLNSTWGTTDPSIFSFGTGPTNVAGMVAYNVSLNGTSATNGSGAGLRRLSCRTDMFAGTDLPYNSTQLGTQGSSTTAGLDGPPGSESGGTAPQYNCDNNTLNTTAVPPAFGPQPSAGPWPASGDVAANAMGLPIAAGAVAMAVNLNGMCTAGTPTALNLTADELDKIWQGTINQWNDPELVTTNPILGTGTGNDNCSGNIQRVVRQDNSGTTAITMFTLNGIDQGALCGSDNATNWYSIGTAGSNNGQWPQYTGTGSPDCVDGSGHHAPNPITAATGGSPPLISLLDSTNGGIGYAELGLWGTLPAGVSFVHLQTQSDFATAGNGLSNATPGPDSNGNAAFASPGNAGAKSNCTLPTSPPTGADALHAVGLGSPNWTNTGTPAAPGKQDVAFTGSGYPACGLTFDLVYTNQSESGEVAAPVAATATPGCQITAPTPTTTNGDQTLPETTVTVASTSGFPPSGTLNVGGQNVTYTGKTATTFTGAAGGSGLVTSGSSVSLVSTSAAATSTSPGVNGACQTVGGAVAGATNDQLRTLYAYFTYVFSPLGQSATYLPTQTLDPLPATWLTFLTQGYQQNF